MRKRYCAGPETPTLTAIQPSCKLTSNCLAARPLVLYRSPRFVFADTTESFPQLAQSGKKDKKQNVAHTEEEAKPSSSATLPVENTVKLGETNKGAINPNRF